MAVRLLSEEEDASLLADGTERPEQGLANSDWLLYRMWACLQVAEEQKTL